VEASISLAEETNATRNNKTAESRKTHWTTHVGQAAAHPAAFVIVVAYALL